MKSCLLDSSRQQIAWLHQPLIGNALPWPLSGARDFMRMCKGMDVSTLTQHQMGRENKDLNRTYHITI